MSKNKHVIVQSLWTGGQPDAREYRGMWLNPKDHWYTFALSACRLGKLYSDRKVVFVGDASAAAVVSDLGLPYNEITDALEGFRVPSCCLNTGRLAAQLTVQQPYYHVASDVVLFKRMPSWLDTHRAVAFGIDPPPDRQTTFDATYGKAAMALSNALDEVPTSWHAFLEEKGAYACQIVGGRDLDFLHGYAESVLKTIAGEVNRAGWERVIQADRFLASAADAIIEGLTLYTHARENLINVTTVFAEQEMDPKLFEQRAAQLGLLYFGRHRTHPQAHHWRTRSRLILKDEFPEVYNRMAAWLGDAGVPLRVINKQANPGCIHWHVGLCGVGEFNGLPSYNDCRNRCSKRADTTKKLSTDVPIEALRAHVQTPGAWTGDESALRVSLEVLKSRQAICDTCVHGKDKDYEGHATRCGQCGCPLPGKQMIVSQSCPWTTPEHPDGKW